MTLEQLRAFVTIVEHGSIRAAARSLDLAQSGLTQQIKRLENSLGVTLFTRGITGISMTEAGEALLMRARIILGECSRTEQEFRFFQGQHVGSITLGVSFEAFAKLIPPVLREFRSRFPLVNVHFSSGPAASLLSGLREGRLDFVLTLVSESSDMTDLVSTVIDRSHPAIACRKGHSLQHATSIRELADAEWINTRPPGKVGIPSNRLVDLFHAAGIPSPKIVVTAESLFDTLHLVSKTDYLFLAPGIAIREGAYREMLNEIPIREAIPEANVCLVERAAAPLAPLARTFASMLCSYGHLLRKSSESK